MSIEWTDSKLNELIQEWTELNDQATELALKVRPDLRGWDTSAIDLNDSGDGTILIRFKDYRCGGDTDSVRVPFYAFCNAQQWLDDLVEEQRIRAEAEALRKAKEAEVNAAKAYEDRRKQYEKLKQEFE